MARQHSAIAIACLALGLADVIYLNVAVAPSYIARGAGPVLLMERRPPVIHALVAGRVVAAETVQSAHVAGSLPAEPREMAHPRDPELAAWSGAEPEPHLAGPGGDERRDGDDGAGGEEGPDSDDLAWPDTLAAEAVRVPFDRGGDDLTADARAELASTVRRLLTEPALHVVIDGHADRESERDAKGLLSRRRAEQVAAYLEAEGIGRARMSLRSFAGRRPVDGTDTTQGRRLNRRVEIRVGPSPRDRVGPSPRDRVGPSPRDPASGAP